tara:strand:+ start:230 stop:718 length:489 start_codon:yes stop_codon:yes gene_type:complete
LSHLPVYEMSLADCAYVCQNMREDDFKETSSLTFAKTKEAMAKVILNQGGESYTIFNRDGEPVVIGGAYYSNPKVATIWLLATDKISKRDWWMTTKFIMELMQLMFENNTAHRIQAQSIGWRHVAHKWLQRIGLSQEGHLKGFAEDGYDVLIFGKTKENSNG